MPKKILIADPNKSEGASLGEVLKKNGFHPIVIDNGSRVIDVAKEEKPFLVVLEVLFQEPTGFEICKKMQSDSSLHHLPIIMLSEQAEDFDRILGLELGAEDYLKKPCHPREITLKIKKIISRYRTPTTDGIIHLGEMILDKERCEVRLRGKALKLTAMEFKLLYIMAERYGRVQSRDRLLHDVWGYDSEINSRTLDTHIRNLRVKLTDHESYVQTAYGFGYRVISPESSHKNTSDSDFTSS